MKKIVLLASVLALLSTTVIVGYIKPVVAQGIIYIRADGSIEGTTEIMTVDNVTYTFTDNINGWIIVERDDIVVDGAGYTLQGTGSEIGIYLLLRSNVTIKNMEIKNFWAGIQPSFSSNNRISGNNITAFDYCGILMDLYASHSTISGNTIKEPSQPNCHGIYLGENSGNNMISGNYFDGFWLNGIMSEGSSNNIISGNTIKDNMNGIYLHGGSNNRIYHNNFIGVPNPCFFEDASMHTFDAGYPLGGNYWSDYNGADLFSGLFQNETGSDGIGDTPYVMPFDNEDNYPLMGMFSDFNATSQHYVQTICNSTISDFKFNGTAISFNVTGETDTTGFCRICIPRALMNETHQVFVNGTEVQCNLLPCSNTTHSYLYFTYNHSTQEVIIQGSDTAPPIIYILSPENKTYPVNYVPLTFTVSESTAWIGYSLDGQMNVTISGNYTIVDLSDGTHIITVYANDTAGNIGSSDIVYFTIQTTPIDTTPPSISIVSPENKTYYTTDIPLTFTVDETVSWIGYSLDGQASETITGNTTLTGLSDEIHSVTVYANDTAGNIGSSEVVYFTIETEKEEEALPTLIVAVTVTVAVVGVAIGAIFLWRRRK